MTLAAKFHNISTYVHIMLNVLLRSLYCFNPKLLVYRRENTFCRVQINPHPTELATDLLRTSPSKLAVAMRFGTPKATQSMSSEWACSYVQKIEHTEKFD